MDLRRLIGLGCLATAVHAAAPAQAETWPRPGGEVLASLIDEPIEIDPLRARRHSEWSLVGLVFDTLYQLDADRQPTPQLAIGWPTPVEGGLRIEIGRVRSHRGAWVGAVDVAASLERARAHPMAGWVLADVLAVRVDGDAVILTTAREPAVIAARLALPSTAITPGGTAPKWEALDGTGPFAVAAVDRGRRRIDLIAHAEHHAGPPMIRSLALAWFVTPDGEARRFEDGNAHASLRGATVFAGHLPRYQTTTRESAATLLVYVGFGRAHAKLTDDTGFREALDLALPRGDILGYGEGAVVPTTWVAPGATLSTSARTGDLGRAASLMAPVLARAGAAELEVLLDASRPEDRDVGERLLRALDKLGLRGRLREVEGLEFARRVRVGECDLYVEQGVAAGDSAATAAAGVLAGVGLDWPGRGLARGPLEVSAGQRLLARRRTILPIAHRAVRATSREDVIGLTFDWAARVRWAEASFYGWPRKAVR